MVGDIYLLLSMDRGEIVDVPWHLAKFMSGGAKGFQKKRIFIHGAHLIGRLARNLGLMRPTALSIVTRGQETDLISIVKLVKFRIYRINRAGEAEMEPAISGDGSVAIRSSQASGC